MRLELKTVHRKSLYSSRCSRGHHARMLTCRVLRRTVRQSTPTCLTCNTTRVPLADFIRGKGRHCLPKFGVVNLSGAKRSTSLKCQERSYWVLTMLENRLATGAPPRHHCGAYRAPSDLLAARKRALGPPGLRLSKTFNISEVSEEVILST